MQHTIYIKQISKNIYNLKISFTCIIDNLREMNLNFMAEIHENCGYFLRARLTHQFIDIPEKKLQVKRFV